MSEELKKDLENESCCNDEGCDCEHDHDEDACGCGHDHHHHQDTITLTMENDEEVECAVLGIFDVDDQEYIALLPNDGEDVFIYHYSEDEDGEVSLENIDSSEEFDKVSAVFLEIIESEEDDDDYDYDEDEDEDDEEEA